MSTIQTISFAKDIVVTEEIRNQYIQAGEVWQKPTWMDDNFNFLDSFTLLEKRPLKENESVLNQDTITCQITDDTLHLGTNSGKTPKFFCRSNPTNLNDSIILKVKYGKNNGEIYGEQLATKLLWALGFYSDRMYFVNTVYCKGCSEDPFKNRTYDLTTVENPRLYQNVAIERKLEGDQIVVKRSIKEKFIDHEGFSLIELMQNLPDNNKEQIKTQRDALNLLAGFIQHVDNKAGNQRILCQGKINSDLSCDGKIILMIQDGGATFGKGKAGLFGGVTKVNLNLWSSMKIWSNSSQCITNMGFIKSQDSRNMQITESGRQFLLKLLDGLTNGPNGLQRIKNLFLSSHVENFNGNADKWAEVFLNKIEQIRYPMGKNNPDFKCPVN